jgi:predicted phage-related endonuclease
MLALGVAEWDLCVLLPNYEIRIYPLTLDTDVAKAMLINYMAFWENNVKPAIPPQLRNFEAPEVLRALTKHYNKVIEGEVVDMSSVEGLVSDYYHAGKVIAGVSKQRDKLKALILKDMKNSQLGMAGRFTIERTEVKKKAYQVKEQVNIKLTVKDTQAIGKEEREEIE